MSGQPSPYSTPSDDQRDAARWRRFVKLTQLTMSEMTPDEWDCWRRALQGGPITEDLLARIDALIASDKTARGGDAGAQQA